MEYDVIIVKFLRKRALRKRSTDDLFPESSICSTLLNVRHPVGAISIPVIKIPQVIKTHTQ